MQVRLLATDAWKKHVPTDIRLRSHPAAMAISWLLRVLRVKKLAENVKSQPAPQDIRQMSQAARTNADRTTN